MAGCGTITTRAELDTWLIATLTVTWHNQISVTNGTKFADPYPTGPGMDGAAVMSLGHSMGAAFNVNCGTQFAVTDFFGCAKVSDMGDVLAKGLGL
jgi:hypothetical protein